MLAGEVSVEQSSESIVGLSGFSLGFTCLDPNAWPSALCFTLPILSARDCDCDWLILNLSLHQFLLVCPLLCFLLLLLLRPDITALVD